MNRREAMTMMAIAAGSAALPARAARGDANPADLHGDIAIVREALKLHPGLYRYDSPAAIDARLAVLDRDFAGAADRVARYLILSRFLATIRCGHTYCNFLNQSDAVATDLFDRPTRLPFYFRWLGHRMIVTADHSGTGKLHPGSEIVAINGVPAHRLLIRLMPYARADGHNDAKRVSLLEVHGNDTIGFFDVFHGLVFGAPARNTHKLLVRSPGGMVTPLSVVPLTLAQRRAAVPTPPAGPTPIWRWELRADGIAVLDMPSWALYDSAWDWKTWLSDRLNSLKGAKGLIIDLRENEGGEDCGDTILARLTDRDIRPETFEQKLRFQRAPATLDRYLKTWDDSFRTLGVGGQALGDGFYARPGGDTISLIAAVKPRIDLPVAALIGPVNSSATFGFASTAKATGLIRLFGSMTGGNRRGINGGCFFFVRLPASGLEFDLPLVGEFARRPVPDAGLEPDVSVAFSVDDIAHRRDPVRDRAITWIGKA